MIDNREESVRTDSREESVRTNYESFYYRLDLGAEKWLHTYYQLNIAIFDIIINGWIRCSHFGSGNVINPTNSPVIKQLNNFINKLDELLAKKQNMVSFFDNGYLMLEPFSIEYKNGTYYLKNINHEPIIIYRKDVLRLKRIFSTIIEKLIENYFDM